MQARPVTSGSRQVHITTNIGPRPPAVPVAPLRRAGAARHDSGTFGACLPRIAFSGTAEADESTKSPALN